MFGLVLGSVSPGLGGSMDLGFVEALMAHGVMARKHMEEVNHSHNRNSETIQRLGYQFSISQSCEDS
jgi:hypothetical protein